jgi:hypothetical protein
VGVKIEKRKISSVSLLYCVPSRSLEVLLVVVASPNTTAKATPTDLTNTPLSIERVYYYSTILVLVVLVLYYTYLFGAASRSIYNNSFLTMIPGGDILITIGLPWINHYEIAYFFKVVGRQKGV